MSRILVTGGAGFIGSHLCSQLLSEGHDVLCVDNFYTGSKHNIVHLIGSPYFELITQDVTLPLYFEVDKIYSLACPASPVHYQDDPVQTVRVNVLGAINVLDLARRTGAKILQASTSEVYGDPKINPQPESYWGNVNPIGVRSCYDEGKRCVETLFFDYHRQYRVSTTVARIFNTYGPNMHHNDGRVVPNFIINALNGEPLVVHGKGDQSRSFCYIDDTVEGILSLMNSNYSGPINIGYPSSTTILELAEIIIALTSSRSSIVFDERRPDDPVTRLPDTTLAREILEWEPKIELEEGLKRTIEYYERRKE